MRRQHAHHTQQTTVTGTCTAADGSDGDSRRQHAQRLQQTTIAIAVATATARTATVTGARTAADGSDGGSSSNSNDDTTATVTGARTAAAQQTSTQQGYRLSSRRQLQWQTPARHTLGSSTADIDTARVQAHARQQPTAAAMCTW